MDYELPGGAWIEGSLVCNAKLHPITGLLEQELHEACARSGSWRQLVSSVLTVAVDRLGAHPCSEERIDSLAVADRQYLLLQLSRLLQGDEFWTSGVCVHCRAMYDIEIRRSQLPIKRAAAGYPFSQVDCGGKRVQLRVPTGADQRDLPMESDSLAMRALVQRCLVSVDETAVRTGFVEQLSAADIARIEAALDDISPHVGTHAQIRCPECAEEQVVEVDPYALGQWSSPALYQEVHLLARHYHWSEAEILALPHARRHLYLDLIDQERRVHQ